jgi:hypothetical protein
MTTDLRRGEGGAVRGWDPCDRPRTPHLHGRLLVVCRAHPTCPILPPDPCGPCRVGFSSLGRGLVGWATRATQSPDCVHKGPTSHRTSLAPTDVVIILLWGLFQLFRGIVHDIASFQIQVLLITNHMFIITSLP